MGNLAKQLSGQGQLQVFKKGGMVESKEPKREERREAKMTPAQRRKAEKAEAYACGGSVKKGKK